MTGSTSSTIHSGLDCEVRKPSTTFIRLAIFLRFCLERVFSICSSSVRMSSSRSRPRRSFLTASAPMSALNMSWYFSCASRYSCSVRIWPFASGVSPGSVTIQSW